MSPALQQLVREVMDVTAAPPPDLLEDDSPILADAALSGDDGGFYLVGLIGGKEVGKSALINALVGKSITAVTSHGAGTETVIAYAHASQQQSLRELLEREVPGQFRIVSHDQESLRRQVLLDLPDIDSRYASHLALTRTMLRHMLYPVWVGSIEKYADHQPQTMLARVAEGNVPENFVFCLNKVDQLDGLTGTALRPAGQASAEEEEERREEKLAAATVTPTPWGMAFDDDSNAGALKPFVRKESRSARPAISHPTVAGPVDELRSDYSARIAGTLGLQKPPRVFMISAKKPNRFELPALREMLSSEKSAETVRESKQSATLRQDRALSAWLDGQELPLRARRLAQLHADAENQIAARVGGPVLERIVPRLLDDPATRFAMADEILQDRVERWPIVNLIHTMLQPLFVLLRSAVARGAMPMQGPQSMVDSVIRESGEEVGRLIQSAFAQLRQSQPALASLYVHNKLWEDMPADQAAANLRRALGDTVQRQRGAAKESFARRGAMVGWPFRWLLTIGALLWFPFIQPILEAFLTGTRIVLSRAHWMEAVGLLVRVLGVDYLWKSAGFLIIYYIALWLALRWNTQRKVTRLLARWRATDFPDPDLNLATQTIRWMDELAAPIALADSRMQALADRAAALRPAA